MWLWQYGRRFSVAIAVDQQLQRCDEIKDRTLSKALLAGNGAFS